MPAHARCCVPGCTSYNKQNFANLPFHRIPVNKVLARKWLHQIKNPKLSITHFYNARVCGKHFNKDQYKHLNKNILKEGVIPMLFLPNVVTKTKKSSKKTNTTKNSADTMFSVIHNSLEKKLFSPSKSVENVNVTLEEPVSAENHSSSEPSIESNSSKTYDFNKTCRICLVEKEDLHNIQSDFIQNMIQVCDVLKFSDNDTFPKQICTVCISELKIVYNFSRKCGKSTDILHKYTEKLVTTNGEDMNSSCEEFPGFSETVEISYVPTAPENVETTQRQYKYSLFSADAIEKPFLTSVTSRKTSLAAAETEISSSETENTECLENNSVIESISLVDSSAFDSNITENNCLNNVVQEKNITDLKNNTNSVINTELTINKRVLRKRKLIENASTESPVVPIKETYNTPVLPTEKNKIAPDIVLVSATFEHDKEKSQNSAEILEENVQNSAAQSQTIPDSKDDIRTSKENLAKLACRTSRSRFRTVGRKSRTSRSRSRTVGRKSRTSRSRSRTVGRKSRTSRSRPRTVGRKSRTCRMRKKIASANGHTTYWYDRTSTESNRINIQLNTPRLNSNEPSQMGDKTISNEFLNFSNNSESIIIDLTLSENSDSVESIGTVGDTVLESTETVGDTVLESTETVGDTVVESTDTVGDTVVESTDTVGDTVVESTETVGNTLSVVINTHSDTTMTPVSDNITSLDSLQSNTDEDVKENQKNEESQIAEICKKELTEQAKNVPKRGRGRPRKIRRTPIVNLKTDLNNGSDPSITDTAISDIKSGNKANSNAENDNTVAGITESTINNVLRSTEYECSTKTSSTTTSITVKSSTETDNTTASINVKSNTETDNTATSITVKSSTETDNTATPITAKSSTKTDNAATPITAKSSTKTNNATTPIINKSSTKTSNTATPKTVKSSTKTDNTATPITVKSSTKIDNTTTPITVKSSTETDNTATPKTVKSSTKTDNTATPITVKSSTKTDNTATPITVKSNTETDNTATPITVKSNTAKCNIENSNTIKRTTRSTFSPKRITRSSNTATHITKGNNSTLTHYEEKSKINNTILPKINNSNTALQVLTTEEKGSTQFNQCQQNSDKITKQDEAMLDVISNNNYMKLRHRNVKLSLNSPNKNFNVLLNNLNIKHLDISKKELNRLFSVKLVLKKSNIKHNIKQTNHVINTINKATNKNNRTRIFNKPTVENNRQLRSSKRNGCSFNGQTDCALSKPCSNVENVKLIKDTVVQQLDTLIVDTSINKTINMLVNNACKATKIVESSLNNPEKEKVNSNSCESDKPEQDTCSENSVKQDTCSENSMTQDTCLENSVKQDTCLENSVKQDTCSENSVKQDTCSGNSVKQDTCSENSMTQDTCLENSVKQDTCSENSVKQDTCSENSVKQDTCSENSMTQDTCLENSVKQDTCSENSVKQDTCSENSVKQDTCSENSMKQDTCSENSGKQDTCSETNNIQQTTCSANNETKVDTCSDATELDENICAQNSAIEHNTSVENTEKDLKTEHVKCLPDTTTEHHARSPETEVDYETCSSYSQTTYETCSPNSQPENETCSPNSQPENETCSPNSQPENETCLPNSQPENETCSQNTNTEHNYCSLNSKTAHDTCSPNNKTAHDTCSPNNKTTHDICSPNNKTTHDTCSPNNKNPLENSTVVTNQNEGDATKNQLIELLTEFVVFSDNNSDSNTLEENSADVPTEQNTPNKYYQLLHSTQMVQNDTHIIHSDAMLSNGLTSSPQLKANVPTVYDEMTMNDSFETTINNIFNTEYNTVCDGQLVGSGIIFSNDVSGEEVVTTVENENEPISYQHAGETNPSLNINKESVYFNKKGGLIVTSDKFASKDEYSSNRFHNSWVPIVQVKTPTDSSGKMVDTIQSVQEIPVTSDTSDSIDTAIPTQDCETSVVNAVEQNLPQVGNTAFCEEHKLGYDTDKTCPDCKETVNIDSYEAHVKQHENEETFFCEHCGCMFYDSDIFINHQSHHIVAGMYKCLLCQMYFDTKFSLSKHLTIHTSSQKNQCKYCQRKFARTYTLISHLSKGTCLKKEKYKCSICNVSFSGKAKYTKHVVMHINAR